MSLKHDNNVSLIMASMELQPTFISSHQNNVYSLVVIASIGLLECRVQCVM